MKKRMKVRKGYSKKLFSRTSGLRTKKGNVKRPHQRGGGRM